MSHRYEEYTSNDVTNELRNDTNDEEYELTEEELGYKIIDEDLKASTDLYEFLKDYIENQSMIFPIMDKLNSTNFMIWFSENLDNKILTPK